MESHGVVFKTTDCIGWVMVDRPDKMNTLAIETIRELRAVFKGLQDQAEVRAVVLTGAGDKAFIAGADIGELANLDAASGEQYALAGQELTKIIENLRKPVIAAVNGYALGGGMELALACHIRLASDNARMGLPEVKLGLIPGFGGTQRLARLVGKGKAMELVLTGRMVNAVEALDIGLINAVFPRAELLLAAEKLSREITTNARFAIEHSLEAINRGLNMTLDDGLTLEAGLFGRVCGTADAKEGTTAFLEKRKPRFVET